MSRWVVQRDTELGALTAYLDGGGPVSGAEQSLKAVIYTDVDRRPDTRMAVSEEIKIPAGRPAKWDELTFTDPVRLKGGVAYWFALHGGPTHQLARFYWTSRRDALWILDGFYPDAPQKIDAERWKKTPKNDPDREMCWMIVPR
jgi:hypothetical protein